MTSPLGSNSGPVFLSPFPLANATLSFSTGGTTTVIPAVGGEIIQVYRLYFTVLATTTITFQDGTTALSGALSFAPLGSLVFDLDTRPWFQTGPGNPFVINLSTTSQISGEIFYVYNPL